MKKITYIFILFICFYGQFVIASGISPNDKVKRSLLLKDEIISSEHSVMVNGRLIKYTAKAGTILLKNKNGDTEASVFFITYIKNGVKKIKERPITFSFNGGPGSSSVWLHLGLLGPKSVKMNEDGSLPAPPFKLIPNNYSILDVSDLVFIDPVSTGFSRPASSDLKEKFHGVSEDIASVGEFIRLYLTRFSRWSSPKFIIGESYGTTRAAGLSGFLQNEYGINLNGIMLVSSILNFQTTNFGRGNDLPFIMFLPTYTSSAFFHGKLDKNRFRDLSSALNESEKFAMGDYTLALMKGDLLTKKEMNLIAEKLSYLTGLSSDFIKDKNLRILASDFYNELLKREKKMVGRLDSRLWSFRIEKDLRSGFTFSSDPSYSAIHGPFTSTFNDYVRNELGYKTDLSYEILTNKLAKWNIGKYYGRYINVSNILRNSIVKNPYLKVFVAAGYFDFATPYFAAKYTFNHFNLPGNLRKNITFGFYKAGHMMYINKSSLIKLSSDLKKFVLSSIN